MSKAEPLSNIKSEKACLGALIRSPQSYWGVSEILRADMFVGDCHAQIYQVLSDVANSGRSASTTVMITRLPEELSDGQSMSAYLAVLAANADEVSASDFADQIAELAARRRSIQVGERLIKAAKAGDRIVVDIATEAQQALSEVTQVGSAKHIMSIGELAGIVVKETSEAHADGSRVGGVETGLRVLDEMIGPLMPGDLVSVLGFSGHGKTCLATQILLRAADPAVNDARARPGFFISQEMTSTQIVRRVLAADTGVSTRKQRTGGVNAAEFEALDTKARNLRNLPVYLDGSGRQTMSQIANKCRAMKRLHGIGAVAIDHHRLIRSSNPKWSDIDTIANAAMELKDLAKDIGTVVILLCQAKQEALKRETWRVRAEDIYGGEIVRQCSEIVLSVSIPTKWLRQREPTAGSRDSDKWAQDCAAWEGKGEFGVLKARDGEDGIWRQVGFSGRRARFEDLRE